jgi:hypothetical protein
MFYYLLAYYYQQILTEMNLVCFEHYNTIYCSIIFDKRIESIKFIKIIFEVN